MKKPPRLNSDRGLKVKIRTRKVQWRRLKQTYDAVHQQGMDALRKGDYVKFGNAVDSERVLLKKQAAIAEESLARTKPMARKRKTRTTKVRGQ